MISHNHTDRTISRVFLIVGALLFGLSIRLIPDHSTGGVVASIIGFFLSVLCAPSAFSEGD